MRLVPPALLLALLALPAAAQPVRQAVWLAATMPAEAAGLARGPIADFESRPGGAGLGAALEYRPAQGSGVATVYAYDRGRPGLGPTEVAAEIEAALGEIRALALARRYEVAQVSELPAVPGPDGAPALRCLGVVLLYEGVRPADSFLCIGVEAGRLLKLRMTLPQGGGEAGQAQLQALGRAVVAAARRAG
jgi:hypothetical protein